MRKTVTALAVSLVAISMGGCAFQMAGDSIYDGIGTNRPTHNHRDGYHDAVDRALLTGVVIGSTGGNIRHPAAPKPHAKPCPPKLASVNITPKPKPTSKR